MLLAPFILCFILGLTYSATIGDGRTSLVNGNPVDFSRGSCLVNGESYVSETSVPRDHPCHYCICYAGKIDCFWKKCDNVPQGCNVLAYQDTCNPSLYVCDIPEKARNAPDYTPRTSLPATTVSVSTNSKKQDTYNGYDDAVSGTSRMPAQYGLRMRQKKRFRRDTLKQRLPVDEPFPIKFDDEFVRQLEKQFRTRRSINSTSHDNHDHHHHHHEEQPLDKGCTILGVRYELGEVVGVATDVCQECRCAAQSLYCSPKCCFKPAPLDISSFQIQVYEDTSSRQNEEAGMQHPLYYVQTEFVT